MAHPDDQEHDGSAMNESFYRRYVGAGGLLVVLFTAIAPTLVAADAPGLRGPEAAPAGSVGSAVWSDIQALPPIGGVPAPTFSHAAGGERYAGSGLPAATIYGQADNQPVAAAGFSLRALNPGNWVLDAGLGILSATMQSIQQTLLSFILEAAGTQQVNPGSEINLGCEGDLSMLFCTRAEDILPANDLIAPPKQGPRTGISLPSQQPVAGQGVAAQALRTIWLALQPAALGVLTIVFMVRLGRVMHAGPAAFQSEAKALVLPFLAACVMVAASPMLLRPLLQFFTAINHGILSGGVFGSGELAIPWLTYYPYDFVATMAIGPSAALMVLYIVLFIAFGVAIVRLVKLILLFALAPLAGAMLVDRSTAHYFGNWFSKILELLLHQLGWSVAVLAGSAVLNSLVPLDAEQVLDPNSFTLNVIGTTLILVFMLCQQQLFSGVFALAAGTSSPVMGGAMDKIATGLTVYQGIRGNLEPPAPPANNTTRKGWMRTPKPLGVWIRDNRRGRASGGGTAAPPASGGGNGTPSFGNNGATSSTPGSRARAVTQRPALAPARPVPAVLHHRSVAGQAASTPGGHSRCPGEHRLCRRRPVARPA